MKTCKIFSKIYLTNNYFVLFFRHVIFDMLEIAKVCDRLSYRKKIFMKEFLKTNTVTYNLMSFTAFKSMIIFSLLLDSPKSYKEIQEYLKNHEYIKEQLSVDALRIYFNSLKQIGCNINKIYEEGVVKYSITSHPFQLQLNDKQVKDIIKVYRAISKSIEVSDLISLQNFFNKISKYVQNEDLKLKLKNISPLSNIDFKLVNNLLNYAENNTELTIYYNSPISGKKNITILTDKVCVDEGKLYLYGVSSEYKNYSKFLVSRIIKIVSVNLANKSLTSPEFVVGYNYAKNDIDDFELLPNEKVISEDENNLKIEIISKNKLEIVQRILFLSPNCKVLYPTEFKSEIISVLRKMKEGYFEQ